MKKILIILMLFGIQGSFAQTAKEPNQPVTQDSLNSIIDGLEVDTPFRFVEIMPEFPGGMDSLYRFLRQNLIFPHTQAFLQGTVIVEFIIDSLGKVRVPKVLVPLFPDCDKEALRVVSIMPDWKPGIHKGKPVSVYFMLPIRFVLN